MVKTQRGYYIVLNFKDLCDTNRCDTEKSHHTALLPVQLVLFFEHRIELQSAHCCYACETNCNALYYAMLVEMTCTTVNQAMKNLKLIANIKITIIIAFVLAFSSFCYQRLCLLSYINSLSPVCSYAI